MYKIIFLIFIISFIVGCMSNIDHDNLYEKDPYKQIEVFQKILDNNKNDINAQFSFYNNIGVAYNNINDYEKAIESYKIAAHKLPSKAYYPYLNLAELYYKMGMLDLSKIYIDQAVNLVQSSAYYEQEKSSYYEENFLKKSIISFLGFLTMRIIYAEMIDAYNNDDIPKFIELSNQLLGLNFVSYLGISFNYSNIISEISPGSLADINGLLTGDKIVKVGDVVTPSSIDAYNVISDLFDDYGKSINFTVLRNDREINIQCMLIYPEVEHTKILVGDYQSRKQINMNFTEFLPADKPMIKVLQPSPAKGKLVAPSKDVKVELLASSFSGIREVRVNNKVCRLTSTSPRESVLLPGSSNKYFVNLSSFEVSNKLEVVAVDNQNHISTLIYEIQIDNKSIPSNSKYGSTIGVVIGINDYEDYPNLEYAENDAREVEKLFYSLGFDRVIKFTSKFATRRAILRVLADELPAVLNKNDSVVIYFSGHGDTEVVNGDLKEGYILPTDARKNNMSGTGISMSSIHELTRRYQSNHILLVFDSCYSGLGLARGGSVSGSGPDYLDLMRSKRSIQIITAGGQNEMAREEKGHGIFTANFLQIISSIQANSDDDYILASEIGHRLRKKISEVTNGAQNPVYGWINGDGDYIFSQQ